MTATVDEATTAPGEIEEIKGRSLTQIAWGRLRRDKTFIASAIILGIILLVALFAPLITSWLGLDPYATDKTAISQSGGKPNGPWGGASLEHPLGVEWGTGRDILARLLRNLKEIHRTQEDWLRLIAVQDRLLVLLPDAWVEYRDRGLAWAEMGDLRLAVADLETYVDKTDDTLDREAMQRSQQGAQQKARQSPSGGSASRQDPVRKGTPGEESLNAGGDDPS